MRTMALLAVLLGSLLSTPAYAALMFASGTFTISAGTGAQQITDANCVQPKVILAYWTRATADATFTAHEGFGFGVAVDRATDQQTAVGFFNTDNVATVDAEWFKDVAAFIKNQSTVAPAFDVIATISSFNADGFTINKTTNSGSNLNIVKYVCLGGSDIVDAFLGEYQGPATEVPKAFTGVGFKGNFALFFGAEIATGAGTSFGDDYGFHLGAANGTQQGAIALYGNDGAVAANYSESYIRNNLCLAIPSGNAIAMDTFADFTSFDDDGFTLNYTQTPGAGLERFFALILKGNFRTHIGQQARNTGNGTQDVTTPGFPPAGVLIAGSFATANATEITQGHLSLGAGEATGSVQDDGIWVGDAASINTDVNMYASASKIYTQATNPSTVAAQADLNAWLSNGYQLNWTTTDATARLFMHIVFGSGPAGGQAPIIFQ